MNLLWSDKSVRSCGLCGSRLRTRPDRTAAAALSIPRPSEHFNKPALDRSRKAGLAMTATFKAHFLSSVHPNSRLILIADRAMRAYNQLPVDLI